MNIVFFGIDGAGKTTVIEKIKERLEENGEECEVFYGGISREQRIPFLGKLMKFYTWLRWGEKEGDEDSPRDNYRNRSFPWLIIFYLELWIRYVQAKFFSKNKIVLFDRYFYDGLILSNEFNFKFFSKVTPEPDRSFLLDVPPEVIRDRKKEAELKDIEKFYTKAEYLEKYFDIRRVDNTKDIDVVVEEVLGIIENGH